MAEGSRLNLAGRRLRRLRSFHQSESCVTHFTRFNSRWCYYSTVPSLWNRPRPALFDQSWSGNSFIVTRMMAERPNEQVPIVMTSALPDYHLSAECGHDSFRVRQAKSKSSVQDALFATDDIIAANLSAAARAYLAKLGHGRPGRRRRNWPGLRAYELIWLHSAGGRLRARLSTGERRRHPRQLAAHPAPGKS